MALKAAKPISLNELVKEILVIQLRFFSISVFCLGQQQCVEPHEVPFSVYKDKAVVFECRESLFERCFRLRN